jgi:HlyD family secretion protein
LERAAESARRVADEQLAGRDPDEGVPGAEESAEGTPDAEDQPDAEESAEGAPDVEELAERVEGEIAESIADARQRLAEAEAGYRNARSQLSSAEAQVRSQAQQATAAQEAAAQAQRDQAELALEAARARIDDLVIVAPVGGVIELSRGEPGTSEGPDLGGLGGLGSFGGLGGQVSGGSSGRVAEGMDVGAGQPLLTIYDLSSFTVRADVDELDIVDVEVDQRVVVLIDAFPDAELAGVVSHVALAPRRPAGGGAIFAVTIDLVDVPEEVRLRTGLTASAEIEVRRVQGETVVPTSALLRRGGGEVVYRVRDGVAEELPVTVEAIGDQTAAVSGELDPGDEVVTIGVEMVEAGTEVEVVR